MKLEWDEVKRRANVRKHGIDFADAPTVFNGYTVTMADRRMAYDEERFVTLGLLKERVVVVVHTEHEDWIRIISMRKATKYEEKSYFEQIPY